MCAKPARKIEYGDFQTPDALAAQVVRLLKKRGLKPNSVVEPTCGHGAFVAAAVREFESAREIVGLEINQAHFAKAQARICREPRKPSLDLRCADFFSIDWPSVLNDLPQPLLLLGNPPWVTSSGLGAINGANLPRKSNFQGHRGLDAITGKANFDIAEWMLLRLLEAASGTSATLAMLVKTSVARRVLAHVWRTGMPVSSAAMFTIDAAAHFNVSASACLFLCSLGGSARPMECDVFELDRPSVRIGAIGFRDEALVADTITYDRLQHLIAQRVDPALRWRSGIKHDCSSVMELRYLDTDRYLNGRDEVVHLEPEFLYPMMKGSDVAGRRVGQCRRWMLVPQRSTSDDTAAIAERAPRTWAYLNRHAESLDGRGSSIYRKRPRFAVFGIGPYTFAPWKVAICGLYKNLNFAVVGPRRSRPVVFDDTVYHLSFESEHEARRVATLLNSAEAQQFFHALTFWDAKRPITVDVLARLDLHALARELGEEEVKDCALLF